MMSLESRNKAVVQEYFDRYWAKGDSSVVDELCTDEFLISYPTRGSHHGKKEAKAMIDGFREVYLSLNFSPLAMLTTTRPFQTSQSDSWTQR